MKNMKKIVSLVLAVSLLLSSMTVAFAAVSADVTTAKTVGMIVGEGDGVTDEYAASMPTRAQAALMQLRLMGLEAEATDYAFVEGETETFADAADADDFWQPILAYLYANPELGWEGYEDGTFLPNEYVSFIEYAKVLLTAMGYEYGVDFTWDDADTGVVAFAASLGIEEQTGAFDITALCEATVDALVAETKEGSTLVADLVEAGVIELADAYATGLIAEPTTLEAVTATMPNLAEVVVTFNQDIDDDTADEIKDNVGKYFEVVNDSKSDGEIQVIGKSIDGAVVTLTLTSAGAYAVENQDNVDVTVTDELLDEEVKFDINNVLDATLPTVTGVTTDGPDTFKIEFSEPLKVAADVEINDGEIGAEVTLKDGKAYVTAEANDDLEAGVSYDLEITAAKDYAGYKMLKYTTTVTYEAVEEALTVEVKDVTETTVTIEFSEDLSDKSKESVLDETSELFWHSFSSYEPITVSAVGSSDKKFKIEFADGDTKAGHFVPYADVTFTVETEDKDDDELEDVWGNKMADTFEVMIASEKDETAPTVKLVSAKEAKIVVAFSEDVTGVSTSKVTVKDADDDEVTLDEITYDKDEDEYTIKFKEKVDGGEYTVEFKDVKDDSLAANKMDPNPTVLTVTISDSTAPDLAEAKAIIAGDNKVYVTFPEAMDDSVLDVDMYTATSGTSLQVPEKAEFFGSSNKEVKLTFDEDAVITTGAGELIVGKVADASGNYVKALSTPVTISAVETVAIKGLKTISENRLQVTIDGKIPAGNVDNDYITITEGTTTAVAAAIKDVDYDSDKDVTKITFSLKSSITVAADETDFTVTISDKMKDDKGFKVTTTPYVTAKDGVAPSVVATTMVALNAGVTKAAAQITFDEELTETNETLIVNDLEIVVDGDTLEKGLDYTTDVSGSALEVLVITFVDDDYTYNDVDIVINTVDSPAFIADGSSNEIDDIDEIKIKASKW